MCLIYDILIDSGEALQDTQSYSSDLAYLEDNFELIEVMIKARKTELDDDALLYRADQRKPETVVRELKAKARSIRYNSDEFFVKLSLLNVYIELKSPRNWMQPTSKKASVVRAHTA